MPAARGLLARHQRQRVDILIASTGQQKQQQHGGDVKKNATTTTTTPAKPTATSSAASDATGAINLSRARRLAFGRRNLRISSISDYIAVYLDIYV